MSTPHSPGNTRAPTAAHRLRETLTDDEVCPECLGDLNAAGVCGTCGHDVARLYVQETIHGPSSHNGSCVTCGSSLVRCTNCGALWCLDHTPNPLVCPQCGSRE